MFTPDRPDGPENAYAYRELQRLANYIETQRISRVALIPQTVAPLRPREGDLVMADGVNWDPGSGIGLYQYRLSTWEFLG